MVLGIAMIAPADYCMWYCVLQLLVWDSDLSLQCKFTAE